MVSFLRGLRWLLCMGYLLIVIAVLNFLPSEAMEVALIFFAIVGFCGYRMLFVGDGTSIF